AFRIARLEVTRGADDTPASNWSFHAPRRGERRMESNPFWAWADPATAEATAAPAPARKRRRLDFMDSPDLLAQSTICTAIIDGNNVNFQEMARRSGIPED